MDDKVIVLTGASSGIGSVTAAHMASIGYKKFALVARREEELQTVADMCKEKGAEDVLVLPVDLSTVEGSKEAVSKAAEHFGRLDVLICNAGMVHPDAAKSHGEVCLDGFQKTMDVNFMSPVASTQQALPHLEQTKGNILYVTSVVGTRPLMATGAAYNSSKAALRHFSRCLAQECAPKGIRVNCLSPGLVVTPILAPLCGDPEIKPTMEEEHLDKVRGCKGFEGFNWMGRLGEAEEMAKLVAFIVSDDNSYMTGSEIDANGGMV